MPKSTPTITYQPLHPDVDLPTMATAGSVGFDVRAYVRGREIEAYQGTTGLVVLPEGDEVVLPPGVRAAIPLGFRATLPPGIEAQLRLRSSVAFRRGLVMPNAPATIDPDFPGEWRVVVTNTLAQPVAVRHLERIAQIVFARFEAPRWTAGKVGRSSERSGGFGSTGS